MAADKEAAFVLPKSAAPGDAGPVVFGGFPGVWFPGQPIAVSELGFASERDAKAARDEHAAPLADEKVAVGSGKMPPRSNHIGDQAAAAPLEPEADESEAAA